MTDSRHSEAHCDRPVGIYAGCPCARPNEHDGECSPFGTAAEPQHADGFPFAGSAVDRLYARMFALAAMGR